MRIRVRNLRPAEIACPWYIYSLAKWRPEVMDAFEEMVCHGKIIGVSKIVDMKMVCSVVYRWRLTANRLRSSNALPWRELDVYNSCERLILFASLLAP
jgi:hypothetical protein